MRITRGCNNGDNKGMHLWRGYRPIHIECIQLQAIVVWSGKQNVAPLFSKSCELKCLWELVSDDTSPFRRSSPFTLCVQENQYHVLADDVSLPVMVYWCDTGGDDINNTPYGMKKNSPKHHTHFLMLFDIP